MATQWYLARDGQQYGPYSQADLEKMASSGGVAEEDLLWHAGLAGWQPARTVLDIPLAPPARARRYAYEDDDQAPPARRFSKEDDDLAPRPRSRGPRSEFPGRLLSPSGFMLAILFFPLPWVSVQCPGIEVHQSGLQSCWGGYTVEIFDPGFGRNFPGGQGALPGDHPPVPAAPLVLIFILVVITGLILALAMPVGWARFSLVACCATLGFLMLLIQAVIGFPFANKVKEENQKALRDVNQMGNQLFNQLAPNQVPKAPGLPGPLAVQARTTPWFWLTLLAMFIPMGLLFVENYAVFADRFGRRAYG